MASGLVSSLLSSASNLLAVLRSPSPALYPRSGHHTASTDLQRLKRLLSHIQATLDDAEEQGIHDNYVMLWLTELKDLARDAEDVLDDCRYELLRCQVQECQADFPRKRKHMDDEDEDDSINERINEITNRFEEICRYRAALELRSEDGKKIADRVDLFKSQPTSHLLDESVVFGRIDEKESIVQSILSQSMKPGIVVLPIVGMGGIGKTTIAQMVYNDYRVRKIFDHSGWIHVSPVFDVHKLTISITESLTKRNCGFTQLSLVHEVLSQEVFGKKLFFVLDDLWNECENYWKDLLCPLKYAQTVTILVTTRSKEVARIVQTVPPFLLGCIPENDCWLLLKYYAFRNNQENEQSRLGQIGRKIMQKCGGLPLALKSIGCLLHSKADEHTWMEILESELWELDEKDDIFPALRLSYYRLPTRLKPCFLLCSLYPSNLGFTKDEMVQLWIAQGYIYPTDGKTRQEIGNRYFNELQTRSLIEISSGELQRETQYINELIAKALIEIIHDDIGSGSMQNPYMHIPHSTNSIDIRKSLKIRYDTKVTRLQRKYNKMKESLIEAYLEKTSRSVQHFKLHDVIFDLAKTLRGREQCTEMLDTICDVPNELHQLHASEACRILLFREPRSLQTLVLNCCVSPCLIELTRFIYLRSLVLNSNNDISDMVYSIGYLRHLRYLFLNCNLQELPDSLCRLYSLETLVISSLRTLRASNFHNLVSLRYLDVSFEFMDGFLGQFGELHCLDTVCLKGCGSITFLPLWKGSLFNLQRLQLVGILSIKHLDYVSSMCNENERLTSQQDVLFPSLEALELENLCKLESWQELQHSDCPKLQSLTIRNCPKLSRIPCFASLRKLVISESAVEILQFSPGNVLSKLRSIDIRDCLHLTTLVGVKNLSCLTSLYIVRCPGLLILPSEDMPCKPHNAFIADCPQLMQWCEKHELKYFQVTRKMQISDVRLIEEYGIEKFMIVEHLTIEKCSEICPNLLCSTKSWLPSNLQFLQFSSATFFGVLNFHKDLVLLSRLEIKNCTNLQSLDGLYGLESLRELVLVDCPLLDLSAETKFPELLSSLVIRGCHQLLSLHLLMNDTAILRELEISDCRGFMYIGGLSYYTDIESLKFLHCPLLQIQELMTAVPETAVICCCPRLKKWSQWHGMECKDIQGSPEDLYGEALIRL